MTNRAGWHQEEQIIEDMAGPDSSEANPPGDYRVIADAIACTVEEKQEAYGDSFGRSGAVLREMYPDGIHPDQYDDMACVVRIIDKLFRLAHEPEALRKSHGQTDSTA
jgi:hypothetical protein